MKYEDELKGAAIITVVGILLEALDLDEVIDDLTPSLSDLGLDKTEEAGQDDGVERSGSGLSAEELTEAQP